MDPNYLVSERKATMLVALCKRFVGIREDKGQNRDSLIDLWAQRLFGAHGWPWCLIFAQEMADAVDDIYDASTLMCSTNRHSLPHTAHVKTLLGLMKDELRDDPKPGWLAVWLDGDKGHVGVVERGIRTDFWSIEGNTGAKDEREGDGVALKHCSDRPRGKLILQGFVPVWR